VLEVLEAGALERLAQLTQEMELQILVVEVAV
jgi:hypothetical protein